MKSATTHRSSVYELRRYKVETRDTNRFSIGEILSTIKPVVPPNVDRRLGPPLDFSFSEARKMSDFTRVTPRNGLVNYITVPVFINKNDIELKERKLITKKEVKDIEKSYCKYISDAIRMNNNTISSFKGFNRMLDSVLDNPKKLQWIDLSFNDIEHIDEVLLEFQNLKVLYLHSNEINNIKEVDKLAKLKNLKKLTLHANFIEQQESYRWYVIAKIPQLQSLDFSKVIKSDKEKAMFFQKCNSIKIKKQV